MSYDDTQLGLFAPSDDRELVELCPECRLSLHRVFDRDEAEDWLRTLQTQTSWEKRSITMFGRQVLQPRLVGWAGELPYTYSGQTLAPRPWGDALRHLLDLTQKRSGHSFNHALLNFYRDGSDSMGMHSDDEPELGHQPVVASWSFGAVRRFVFAEKRGKRRVALTLPSGSLLVMEGATQRRFRHALPKMGGQVAPRLNVTFRKIVGQKASSPDDAIPSTEPECRGTLTARRWSSHER